MITVVSMALIVVFGKVLANILIADFRGKWVVRFLVLLPWTTPVALSTVSWLWLDSIFSPIDWVLRQVGLIDANMYWLGRPGLATASVIAVHVWPGAAGRGHHPGGPDRHPQGHRGGRAGGRRGILATHVRGDDPADPAADRRRRPLRCDLHVHRHGRGLRPHLGGPTNSTQVLASWAFVRGIEGDVAQGAAIAIFLFPLLLAAAILILRAVRRMQVM